MTDRDLMRECLPHLLRAIPAEWRGTTFNNSNLLGREGFVQKFLEMLRRVHGAGGHVTVGDLEGVGNAEDYLRVSTNISTVLELALALEKGLDVSQVFTFSSKTMPILSVLLSAKAPVHLYLGDASPPFSEEYLKLLEDFSAHLTYHQGMAQPHPQSDIVLAYEAAIPADVQVDGIVNSTTLYITNPHKINPADVLVIRKRTATPITTPQAEFVLHQLAGVQAAYEYAPSDEKVAEFLAHLQTMSGTDVNTDYSPIIFVTGLSAIASLWAHLVQLGGADVLMCSTAYGGSSQLMDICCARSKYLRKHTFHVQGTTKIVDSIQSEIESLANNKDQLLPTTVIFIELPTNPDMKVVDLPSIIVAIENYRRVTGKEVLLLLDPTFAPASQLLHRVQTLAPTLPAMIFVSMSKSVSRGYTTAGGLVANHTAFACGLIKGIRGVAQFFDTVAKPDQMHYLVENHKGVEERCQRAYEVAVSVGEALRQCVHKWTSQDMPLAFVTPEQAAVGYTTSTFSFNLPAPKDATNEQKAALAQRFVDLLTVHREFKPCVSFGQDNGKVYATVPATSTQGAIKEEDKAKQAVGGVQLVRLSFPPTCDVDVITKILVDAVGVIYGQ